MLAAFLLQLSYLLFYTAALPIVSYYPPHKHNKNKPTKHEKNNYAAIITFTMQARPQ